jgi:putative PEP-CTERM system TPR-repeat lipoprotein
MERAAAVGTSVTPRLMLARLHVLNGDFDLARAQVDMARELGADPVELAFTEGLALYADGDAAGAVPVLRDAWSLAPSRPSIALLLAQALVASDEAAQARDVLEEAVTAMPAAVDLRAALGLAELRLGNAGAALDVAKALQSEFLRQSTGYALEGQVRMAERRYGDAAEMFALAFERDESWASLARLVTAHRLNGAPERAVALLTAWIGDNPGDASARQALAEVYSGIGRAGAALAEYLRAVEIDPSDFAALNNAAWYAELEGSAEALSLAEQAFALAPNNPAVLDTYGWILTRRGRGVEAVDHLRKATQLAPSSPDIRYHLALAQRAAGDREAARATLEALLAEGQPFADRDAALELLDSI